MKIILFCGEKGRGVIYGEVDEDPVPGEPVELRDARMVLYWSNECGGILGLGSAGPKTNSRITHAVPRVVETEWKEWIEVTPLAVEEIDKWTAC